MAKKYFIWKDPACNGMDIEWVELNGRAFYDLLKKPENGERRFIRLGNDICPNADVIYIEATESQYQDWYTEYCRHKYLRTWGKGRTALSLDALLDEEGPCSLHELIADIGAEFEQIAFAGGFDHNYVLSEAPGEMKVMARACCKETGIAMEASTECCGVQFYAGNFIGDQTGKGGAAYCDRCGFCLEAQFYPDAVNQKNFPSSLVPAGEVFTTKTIYRFYTE